MKRVIPVSTESKPPFCDKLPAYQEFEQDLSNTLTTLRNHFFKQLSSPASSFGKMCNDNEHPSPYVLAYFSVLAYEYSAVISSQDLVKCPALCGWERLGTVNNPNQNNGYLASVFWHPDRKQVVIANSGTSLKNSGAVWTDIRGILKEKYVPQIRSAMGFAVRIAKILTDLEAEFKTEFQLFLTGHSLGGWLAQITTLSTNYFHINEGFLLRREREQRGFHAHAVVFDSPGAQPMLAKLIRDFDIRYMNRRLMELSALDITTYLTSPNRVNTLNLHVGLIYRIFPDLTDVFATKYTLSSHDKYGILDQLHLLSVQHPEIRQAKAVFEWPLSKNFILDKNFIIGSSEYRKFFRFGKNSNNFHPDENAEIPPEFRYGTEPCEGKLCNLGAFTDRERKFLEIFKVLERQGQHKRVPSWKPDYFEPIVSEFLFHFEIKQDLVIYTGTDGLNFAKAIPVLKSFIYKNPTLMEELEQMLTAKGITSRIFSVETQEYVASLEELGIDFKNVDEDLEVFLQQKGGKRVLIMEYENEKSSFVMAYAYNTFCKFQKNLDLPGKYTLLDTKRFSVLVRLADVEQLLANPDHLMMVEWNTTNEQTLEDFNSLMAVVDGKLGGRLIIVCQSYHLTSSLARHQNIKYIKRKRLKWEKLTGLCRQRILQDTLVNFQGTKIPLREILREETNVPHSVTLSELIGSNLVLQIGDEIHFPNGFDKEMYIDRRFVTQEDKCLTLQEMLQSVLELNDNQVIVTFDVAGAGKSTVLHVISKEIKNMSPSVWVVRIDLNDQTDWLEKYDLAEHGKALEFLERAQNLAGTAKEIFRQFLKPGTDLRLALLLDGFDEICPGHKDRILGLIETLKAIGVWRIWVTSRPHLKEVLEPHVDAVINLHPFSQNDQINYLVKFWKNKVEWAQPSVNLGKEDMVSKLRRFAEQLVTSLAVFLNRKHEDFCGIPLQAKLLGLAYLDEVQKAVFGYQWNPILSSRISLPTLYQSFIKEKYVIWLREKSKVENHNQSVSMILESATTVYNKCHREVAIRELLNEDGRIVFMDAEVGRNWLDEIVDDKGNIFPEVEDLCRIGLVQVGNAGKLHFIHRTFAEYFFAEQLFDMLTSREPFAKCEQKKYFMGCILRGSEYKVVRAFLNGMLEPVDTFLIQEKLKQDSLFGAPRGVEVPDRERIDPVRTAFEEGNLEILHFLEAVDEVAYNRFVKNPHTRNILLYFAAEKGHLQIVKLLCSGHNCPDNTSMPNCNAIHQAAINGHADSLDFLVEEKRGNDINSKCAGDMTPLHHAAQFGHKNAVQVILAKGGKLNQETAWGMTPLDFAERRGHDDVAQLLRREGAQEGVGRDSLNEMEIYMQCDNVGRDQWMLAKEMQRLIMFDYFMQ